MGEIITNILSNIIALLPDDPIYNYLLNVDTTYIEGTWINWLNWFLPVHEFIIITTLWLGAVIVFKVIKVFIDGFSSFGGML